ncbi:neurexin 1-like [Lycorma delicatula]|uniref:neurexin 1-like n=1 Tax=Lycorma delicatula TaxID=130591 RepID=UPI003F5113D6
MFKTRHPTGLLFHTGDGLDYLNLALKEGGIILSMSLGNGKLDLQVKPNKIRFDDNQWHKVTVHRKIQEISAVTSFCRVSLVVDGVYSEHSSTAGTFTILSSSRVYVAGSENTHALPGSRIHNNFIGCLRKVEFTADTVRLNLVELGRTGSKLVAVAGHVDFICQEVDAADPITFTTKASHLVLPTWEATRTGSISLKIRTVEPNGLIMYNIGPRNFHADMFALELMSGHLYLHLDLGSGAVKVKGTMRRIDDGMWHEISLRRNGKEGRLTIDGNTADFSTPGDSNHLDLEGGLYVGGLGASHHHVPSALWSAVLRQGFVGCMRDLVVNGDAIDIAHHARQQDSGSIQPACHRLSPQCDSQPCMNSGTCSEGWNRFICDCSTTNFIGPTCGKEATTLSFNGSQYMAVHMPEVIRMQTEDITLRFRTTRPLGLLLSTTADQSADRLQLALDSGRVKLTIRIGDKDKTMLSGQGLNDNQWHTVTFSRRASNLNLQVDDEVPVRVETVLGKQSTLELQGLYVGGYSHNEEVLGLGTINLGMNALPSFTGLMQQFSFNGMHYFEIARTAGNANVQKGGSYYTPQIFVTANFSKRDNQLVHHPVTFRSKHTFVGLPVLKAYSTTNIYFQFKTRESSGLIMYNAGREQDFIAVELINGHLQYIFNLGDGPVRVRDNARSSLNDNRWHAVTIGRPSPKQHTLMVDDNFAIVTSLGHNEKLDLAGILYLGGIPKDLPLPKQIQSKHGYEGCLASLDLNGESPNVIVDAIIASSLVSPGCDGHNTKCSHNICSNRGVCVQQWNSYTCDCDMTSYTGPTCSEESRSCEFGPNRGLITYVFPEDRRPEMKSDVLAVGFITTKEDAVLLRVDSGTSNDYMELEIVEGNIFMVYNMGTNDHPIGEISVKVSDNAYHVVRFTRSGANSTIQVDDYNVQTNHPAGHQLTVFNSQAQIQVGGKWNRAKQRVERAFSGVMSGLVFNGLRLLDLAAEHDPRTEVRGDVTFLTSMRDRLHDPLQRMQQTPSSGFPGVMDDLVFSGAGSGCNADDEDQCTPVFETGSVDTGDDLITPVYVPPTRPPVQVTTKDKLCDDEEDCFTGSGSGEVTSTPDEHGTTIKEGSTVGVTSHTSHTAVPSGSVPGIIDSSGTSTIVDGGATSDIPYISVSSSSGSSSIPSSPSFSAESSSTTSTVIESTTPTTTTTQYRPPPPPPPPQPSPIIPIRDRDRISSQSAENTALIIGIIAGTMILIVLVILLVLKFKNRSGTVYKVDERKTFNTGSQGQSAALLGANQSPPTPQAINGNVRNGNGKTKKRELKDIKEWYV